MDQSAALALPPDPAAVREARTFLRQHCLAWGIDGDSCDSAVLMLSETVTNAFTHGRSEARIRLALTPHRLRVEVADDNSRHPQPVDLDDDALDGRGVAIIEALASSWGVADDMYGKTVWFEVDRSTGSR